MWVVGFVILITAINLKSVNLVANFNTLFVLAQVAIILVFIYLVVRGLHNGEGWARCGACGRSSARMRTCCRSLPAPLSCASFLGFDAVTTLCEETPDAAKVIPRAIFLTALYGGVIFISVSFFIQLFFPSIQRFHQPDAALPEIALYVGGKLFQSIFLCVTFINTLASGRRRTPACRACCT